MSIEIIEANWNAPRRIRALCTTRHGGASSEPYGSLNLAAHVGDDPGNLARNRELIRQSLNLPGEPNWLEQTHSTSIIDLDRDNNRTADAAISGRPDTIAVVMVADCLPILLCNRAGTEVAAVHAGWRGLVDGVVQAAVQQMESTPGELLAWIGPAISQAAFEVGEEVRHQFLAKYNRADERFVVNSAGRWLADLPGMATDILVDQGVAEIHNSERCSYTDEALFFSYRRKHTTGRMAAMIWIDSRA